jgi:hypothetical protein
MSNANSQIESRPHRRWLQFTVRSLLAAMLLVALFFGTNGCGLIGLHYPRAVENDPLLSPIRVLSAENNGLLHLEDGRVLRVDQVLQDDCVEEIVKASDNRVDVESDGSQGLVVFVKTRGWICGTPWARFVNFRLIPDDVPINRREPLGYATVQRDTAKSEKRHSG